MKFQCLEHGGVDYFEIDGYSIAHESQVTAHEKDFEGITFIVENPDGEEITAENIRSQDADDYLEKFAGWDEEIASVIQNYYDASRGREELICPHNKGGRFEGGKCTTHIVDRVFIPEVDGNVFGDFMVYDNELNVRSVQYEDLGISVKDLFEHIIEKTNDMGIDRINVHAKTIANIEEPLRSLGFDVCVEQKESDIARNTNYGIMDSKSAEKMFGYNAKKPTYKELKATKNLL